jgi:hypothetical protein
MPVTRRDSEAGFTMVSVILGLSLVVALSIVAVTAVSGDIHSNRRDLDHKRAFEAAKAGVNDYIYHLHKDNSYWTDCTEVEPPKNAVNQVGSTAKRRAVPGNTGGSYAIELLPAEGQTTYSQCSRADPAGSMLEPSGLLKGTFRIRSTGFSNGVSVPIVATFKPATFLDYVYFTQRETLDPVTYGFKDGSTQLLSAEKQCSKTLEAKPPEGGRNEVPIEGTWNPTRYCVTISFANSDSVNGPMHTNDTFVVCGYPTLGRSAADPIEVSARPRGWYATSEVTHSGSGCNGDDRNFKGTFTASSPVLTPPPSNSELSVIAGLKFTDQVHICLSGESMTVGAGKTCTESVEYSGPIPGNGVVYVESGTCEARYSPFTATYPSPSGCGNAYVHGTYSGQLTIATKNDIIIDGDLIHSGEGVLGLVANNFVRIYHPFTEDNNPEHSAETGLRECHNGHDGPGEITDLRIDAAILAINHSFIVDHYDCGNSLGTLTVNGAIAQMYRGPTGLTNGVGYSKSYNYDDRLRFIQPPSFIQPKESDWVIGRETIG